jgi:tetratricopeptide (TPR) repeat protein
LRKPQLQKIAFHLQGDRMELAEKELGEHLARHPDDVDAIMLAARAAARGGHHRKAATLLARCLDLAPDFAAARFEYAKLLIRLSRFGAVLREVELLLNEDPGNPLFRQMKAGLLGTFGRDEESLAIWEGLVAEDPDRAESWIMYGHALRATGHPEKSIAAYRRAIAYCPSNGVAWWGLANMKTARFSDTDIGDMQEQLKRTDIAVDDRIDILASLGKAHEDLRAYDKSFDCYARANATMRLRIDYDWADIASLLARNKALFTPEFFRNRSDAGCKASDPIFIVGRPRSGSTLIEQILSSHPAIEGTAELPYIAALAGRLEDCEYLEFGTDYPGVLERLDIPALMKFGEEYLEDTRAHRKLGRRFFIDKSPSNWFHIGMIHLILPNAKIIDARRNPAACCLSMFKQKFSDTNLRLNELGRLYRDYVELMAHFDTVLPRKIHRVIYENLVADPETEIRKLTDYLGLPFEESCLRFYETERTVRTPSSEQVRRPISGEAVEHWRNYEPWLGPLIKSLGTVLAEYPSVPEELR